MTKLIVIKTCTNIPKVVQTNRACMNDLPNKPYVTIAEAAQYLGVSPKTLRRWEEKGVLIPIRTEGNQRRYTPNQIARYRIGLENKSVMNSQKLDDLEKPISFFKKTFWVLVGYIVAASVIAGFFLLASRLYPDPFQEVRMMIAQLSSHEAEKYGEDAVFY